MGLKNLYRFVQETYMTTVLKHKGYSMIDVTGDDGVVNTYFKKIGIEKEIKIGKYTYPINKNKKMLKNGMPYFRFTRSAFGEDKTGKCTITNIDGDILQELIKKARLVGQNTTKGSGNMYIYIGLGVAIGFLIGWMVLGMFGV